MDIKKYYRFNDFTIDNYLSLLKFALKKYNFALFSEEIACDQRVIYLRHDLEFSVPIALKMAIIESELGIRATYLIQIHSDFYNIFERNNFLSIKKIQSLGHEIGLHFDSHFWQISHEDELEKYLQIDKKVMQTYFESEPKVFSFHNTNSFLLSWEKEKYAGMLNVYSNIFKTKVGYCSDSTGYWRYEILEERIIKGKDDKLQILIHDGMWQDEVLPPRRRIYKVIDEQATSLKNTYDETLKKFGAKNIDWNEIL